MPSRYHHEFVARLPCSPAVHYYSRTHHTRYNCNHEDYKILCYIANEKRGEGGGGDEKNKTKALGGMRSVKPRYNNEDLTSKKDLFAYQ